jgi:hypothetical protein
MATGFIYCPVQCTNGTSQTAAGGIVVVCWAIDIASMTGTSAVLNAQTLSFLLAAALINSFPTVACQPMALTYGHISLLHPNGTSANPGYYLMNSSFARITSNLVSSPVDCAILGYSG